MIQNEPLVGQAEAASRALDVWKEFDRETMKTLVRCKGDQEHPDFVESLRQTNAALMLAAGICGHFFESVEKMQDRLKTGKMVQA